MYQHFVGGFVRLLLPMWGLGAIKAQKTETQAKGDRALLFTPFDLSRWADHFGVA